MALREELEKEGYWLFQRRSYLPLVTALLVLTALKHSTYLGRGHEISPSWELFCLVISGSGLAVRALAAGCAPKGTSGRTLQTQVAESLNTTGMYSVVRHPLYLGNFLITLGVSLLPRVWWLSVIITLLFWLYYERIMLAEEEFLRKKFGEAYLAWANRTPAFLPRFHRWRRSSVPFSLRRVMKRENSSIFGVISTFALIDVISERLAEGRWTVDRPWVIAYAGSILLYATLRFLSKRTTLLESPGH